MSTAITGIFGPDEKCVNVALDHGLFNERSFLDGIEDMSAVVRSILEAGPDAVQLSPGMARLVRLCDIDIDIEKSPALVLRTDIANVYGRALPRRSAVSATKLKSCSREKQHESRPFNTEASCSHRAASERRRRAGRRRFRGQFDSELRPVTHSRARIDEVFASFRRPW